MSADSRSRPPRPTGEAHPTGEAGAPAPLPHPGPSLELSVAEMRDATERCVRFAIEHVASLADQPSVDLDGAAEVAASLREPLPEAGAGFAELLAVLGRAVPKSFNTAGPGYFAYVPGGGLYPAALGDYLANAVNRYVGVWNAAPALVQLEATAIAWLAELVGYPSPHGVLTSGGSISTLIALVAARRAKLGLEFADGVLYRTAEAHGCVDKAAAIAGFAARNLRTVAHDGRRRLDVAGLERAVEADLHAGLRPFLVVASAGTTNTGAVDPLPEIAALCRRSGLWLHVDGAYGGVFRAVPEGPALVPGLELADSLTLDPHKGLFLPYGTGALLVRDLADLERAHRVGGDYLQDLERPSDAPSFADVSPELSRDFRGLRLWLCLKHFGAAAFRESLREKLELARWAHAELTRTGFECVDVPQLSVVAFRRPPRGGSASDADAFNAALLRRVNGYRRVYLSSTRLDGRFVLRLCVLSFRTHAREVAMAIEDLCRATAELEAESGGPAVGGA